MPERFDVVVAGAGPAGGQCARDLAKRGYDVLVLEREAEASFPQQSNKSTGGTFPRMLGAYGIPDDVVMNDTDSVVLESPNEHFKWSQPGGVLEFADFKRFLVRDGREHGATYWFDARVSEPIVEDGAAVGVRFNGGQEVYADIVVDATGPSAPLASELGVSILERDTQAVGLEWEMEGVDLDHPDHADLTDAMMLRLDTDYAPGGYSWIFHTGGDRAKVGLCYIQSEAYRAESEDMRIDEYLDHWEASDPRLADATRLEGEQHRGSAHIQPPGSISAAGFMAIGDTVPSVDPLWGEGIHKCMASARAAAITADHCLTGGVDVSAAEMRRYDDRWHRDVAPRAAIRLLMTRFLYSMSNDRYDRFMRDLEQLDIDTLADANSGDPLALVDLLHVSDIPLLARFLADNRALVGTVIDDWLRPG